MPAEILTRRLTVPVSVALLTCLLVFAAGVFLGHELPWGAKRVRIERGTVTLHVGSTGVAGFDSDGGHVSGFNAHEVWWTDGSSEGDGDPPCLRVGQPVPAEAGFLWVEHPDGGAHEQVVWIRCL